MRGRHDSMRAYAVSPAYQVKHNFRIKFTLVPILWDGYLERGSHYGYYGTWWRYSQNSTQIETKL